MIIRKRRKRESWNGRIFGSAELRMDPFEFLDEQQFQRELLKEIYRSDRRAVDREFGLIRLMVRNVSGDQAEIEVGVLEAFRNRLRVTDSIGRYDETLACLLPETDEEGTLQVANSLAQIALNSDLEVDTEVSIYPWDDELIVLSDELKLMAANRNCRSDRIDDGDIDINNGDRSMFDPHPATADEATAKSGSSAEENSVRCEGLSGAVSVTRYPFVRSMPTPWSKRAVDITAAATGLLLLSPVFLVAAIAIKLTSRGPVFFRQMREGKNGKPFGILKFRTMQVGAEAKQSELREKNEQDGPAFKLANDPRVTPVGRYLRKSCVDELPQLVNVLLGQMSLVGPRPLPVHESVACLAWQRARLTVLPGLTCTWQVRGGRNVTFAQWMRMDLDYIRQRSFWFDLQLIFETAFVALLHRGSV